MVVCGERKEKRERKGERDGVVQRETRTLPPRPVVLHSYLCLSLSRVPLFRLLPSASCIFRFLPRIVSVMIHWILLTFFTRQPQKACTPMRYTPSYMGQDTENGVQSLSHFRILPSSKELNFLPVSSLARLSSLRSTFTFCANVSMFRTNPERFDKRFDERSKTRYQR